MGILDAVTGMMGGKIDASALQGVMGLLQQHTADAPEGQAPQVTDALVNGVAEKLGLNATMVSAFMPQLMQAAQSGVLNNILDKNNDGKVDLGDVMSLLGK
jgi:hypothetical protein